MRFGANLQKYQTLVPAKNSHLKVEEQYQFMLLAFENYIMNSCGVYNIVSIIFCLPDTPIVSLEDTSYTVNEDVGHVNVCALITNSESCPLQFVFTITLSTRDETAGTYYYIVLCI